jgi:hypothetical protein
MLSCGQKALPTIQALGIAHEGAPTRWKATGLEAWSTSPITALVVLQTLVTQRVVEASEVIKEDETR